MKLQFKLALYNTLTKLAIILFIGIFILFSLEKISYHHISLRLQAKKNELIRHLTSKEINQILNNQKSFLNYNILKEEYIVLRPIKSLPKSLPAETFSTESRTLGQSTDTYRILKSTFIFNNHAYLLEIGETMEAFQELKKTIKGFTLVTVIIALILTLIIDLIFTKYLLNPFYLIIDRKLIKVNDPMNFDYEKIKTSTQDFELLDESINLLMKKITNLFVLEKQFIANVSHELLTPISIISSRLENIVLQDELSEESENKIFASLKTLNRLKSIINSLLLISKVENKQFNKNDMIKIKDVVNEIHEELEDRLEDKKIHFNNNIKYTYRILGNRSLIHTLLFNVINNSIKYNHLEGSITISDNLNGDIYILEINDTGIGMHEKQIERAFNRFEKLDTDEKESYGLGLAIVKSITVFHNINVEIQSVKGTGTTIKLIFNGKN